MYQDDFLDKKLKERIDKNALRSLQLNNGLVDFTSNDYLGIAKQLAIINEPLLMGSTGSRLLSGHNSIAEVTETIIASFHQSKSALLFNSGYDANIGLLSSVPQRGDTILYDYLAHASIRDGIKLSNAQSFSFNHNDVVDLEKKIKKVAGTIFIVTESVFSMDGDICPLQELVILAQKYNAHLIIDEAHATGIIGHKGEGLVQYMQLQDAIFARVHTFGKACGCHGAVVLGSEKLKTYLINFARSIMYTTALPPHSLLAIQESYHLFPTMMQKRMHLQQLIQQFQKVNLVYEKLISLTPIQAVIIPGNEKVKKVSKRLFDKGFDVRPILYPTVPEGKERLRIVLHAFNTDEELSGLIECLQIED